MPEKSDAGLNTERIAKGKSRREVTSRQALAVLQPDRRTFDPVVILLASATDRVRQLLPLKYARMKVSPFAFFRGAVSIMAADLAKLPNSGLHAQLCGDAHVQNLGSFAAPDGKLIFDFTDFDETIRGPWEWDVKRMAASMILAGRESGHNRATCKSAAEAFVASYCKAMDGFSRRPVLEVARDQVRREHRIEPIHAALLQSERAHPLDLLNKLTERNRNGISRFRNLRPNVWRVSGEARQAVLHSLAVYRDNLAPERRHFLDLFRPVDVGFKVVGTGSVGLRDYVVLCEGNGTSDPLFLQIKQETASAYAPYLPGAHTRRHEGQRVAEGQRAIQPLSDLLLGWTTIGEHNFLVRQLNDHKGTIDLQRLQGSGLKSLGLVAGELLARGHARSGDACQIRGYCGSGDKITRAIGAFAEAYADQSEADYTAFLGAIRSGKIKAA